MSPTSCIKPTWPQTKLRNCGWSTSNPWKLLAFVLEGQWSRPQVVVGWIFFFKLAPTALLIFCLCTGIALPLPIITLFSQLLRYGLGVDGFYGYIFDIHNQYPQYPIWITEYADLSPNVTGIYSAFQAYHCRASAKKFALITVVLDFMNQTITYLDSLDWVERYAWFGYLVSLLSSPLCHLISDLCSAATTWGILQ